VIAFATSSTKRIIVTSALPYANGPIHIGHLVEYIQTDIYVRFLKLKGVDVVYCCADDTHGTPIELKAKELGISPEQLISDVYKEHVQDFSTFLIEFDSYYSTNSKENKQFSDLFFLRLKEKELVYIKEVEVTYCEFDKRTLPDRYVKGTCPKCGAPDQYGDVCEKCNATYKTTDLIHPYCTLCKNPPIRKKSNHYFFKLSSFSAQLGKWLTENENIQPETKNFALNWIKDGLEDWNISRDGPYFGFKIPGEPNLYYYVWLDAPIGYIASFANVVGDVKLAEEQWNSSEIVHFIGKDIMYFHLLFWPAMLLGAGFQLPKTINVHGFLTVNGEKMSKSRGTFLTAKDFVLRYNPEYLRYYYASMLSKKLADIDLNFNTFQEKINNELVANLGNFCHRVISFANKNFDGTLTNNPAFATKEGFGQKWSVNFDRISKGYNSLNFNEVVREILLLSSLGNQTFQSNEPWKTIHAEKERVEILCYSCVDLIKNLSILVAPILPTLAKEIQSQLGLSNLTWGNLDKQEQTYHLKKEKILINKIEEKKKEVFPLNLKVAQIISVEDHPNADKLYVLQVDVGEKRQLVAGLKGHYTKEHLLGKKLVVITNLKYAKLRGVESQGMLLAGDDGEHVGVLTVKDAPPGAPVTVGDRENLTAQITFDDFAKLTITTKDNKPTLGNDFFSANGELVTVEKVKDGAKVR
jgi:methionyl-tRNA synthetase